MKNNLVCPIFTGILIWSLSTGCISAASKMQSKQETADRDLETISAHKLTAFVGAEHQTRFDLMPQSFQLSNVPWASGFWPDSLGGITRRWSFSEVSAALFFPIPDEKEIKKMSSATLASLSPAEKLDVLAGQYKMPTLRAVRGGEKFSVPEWTGLCDGVAIASSEFVEPDAVTLTNPEGIKVPFASSDIKALLAYFSQMSLKNEIQQLGERCDAQNPTEAIPSCMDISPADFHIALVHRLTRDQKPLMADVTWDNMVWNHAIFGFEFKILENANLKDLSRKIRFKIPSSEIKNVVRLRAKVLVNNYRIPEHWQKIQATDKVVEKFWFYALALDQNGHIKDGVWESFEHPDFIWKTNRSPQIENKTLLSLLQPKI